MRAIIEEAPATQMQIFRRITFPLLTPIIDVVMTFSVLFTFTDFQLIWVLTRGGPVQGRGAERRPHSIGELPDR